MDPHLAATVNKYAALLADAPHGGKEIIIQQAVAEIGLSRPRVYSLLSKVAPSSRKRRANAKPSLTPAEADAISGYTGEGVNSIGKKGRTLKLAVQTLRANGTILAARLDKKTGELAPLSMSAISRALSYYQQHPEQLKRPTPHSNMSYPHPNHTHQVDSSVGIIYYLKDGQSVFELDAGVHYKNKPWNIEAISEDRVIRYALTDMCTGVVRFRYYPKSENARHTVDFLAWCWAPKQHPSDPFHGAPFHLYCDGGIANTLVRRFCATLGVKLIVHRAKNSRATGGVESAHNHAVELPFEHGLRDRKQSIRGFADLNAMAENWQLWWNATTVLHRHGMTRFDAWMHIKPDQLRITCDYRTLLSLATDRPKYCQVQGNLTVMFKARIWDVSKVAGIVIKDYLPIYWHPFIQDCAMAVVTGEDGKETHIQLKEVTGQVDPANNKWGFLDNAAEFGQEYKAKPDTQVDKNRKRIKLVASQSETLEEDERKRKGKNFSAYENRVNPYIEAETAELPVYITKRGTDFGLVAPAIEMEPLSHFKAAKILMENLGALGIEWNIGHLERLKQRFPNGIQESELETFADELAGWNIHKPKLALVK